MIDPGNNAMEGSAMTSFTYQAGLLSGRQLVLLGTAGLHVLVYQVLSLTLGFHPVGDAADHIMKAFFYEDRVLEPTADPLPRTPAHEVSAQSVLPKPSLPDLVFDQERPVECGPGETVLTLGPGEEGVGGQGGPGTAPATALRYTALRPTEDFYPPSAIRLGEEGATVLRVCVSAAGVLQGEPVVTAGSGHPRLDGAAVAWVSQALRFTPATRDGAPVDACKGFRVRFRLRD